VNASASLPRLEPLSSLEVATGVAFGSADPAPLPAPSAASPREALEEQIRPALLRPPCLVSFSGGRDSSAILAVATSLARREGLAVPIPATNVIEDARGAHEADWQELVVSHLGLRDWLRVRHTDELDVIGSYAQRVLVRYGLLWPCNVHFHLPLFDAAAGGSVLTGIGGDELFGAAARPRLTTLRRREAFPVPRDVLRLGLAFAPRPLTRTVVARRHRIDLPWLRPCARRAATAAMSREQAAEPRGLRDRMAWVAALRYVRLGAAAIELLARDAAVYLSHPLLAADTWSAVAAAAPIGFASRTDGMRCLFGDVLAPEIINRRTKAHFDGVFWTDTARQFARGWSNDGALAQWVDYDALRRHWNQPQPLAQSFTLLQAVWLSQRSGPDAADVHKIERQNGPDGP
jgi:asparagine synthetase B (glutamine-hydrolysing)